MNDKQLYLTRRDLKDMFNVSFFTIDRWTNEIEGFPQPIRIGRSVFWKRSDIEEYLEKSRG